MSAYTLRAWLKDDDSVHKRIHLLKTHTFKDLHHTLMKAFELGIMRAVCFYVCTPKWKKRQKIAFSNPDKEKGVITMSEAVFGDFIKGERGYIRYEGKNGAEWFINIEVVAVKKPSSSKRYPDWEDTSGQSLKHLNKRAPVLIEDDLEEPHVEEPEEEEEEGEDNFGKDFDELEVEDTDTREDSDEEKEEI